MQFKTVIELEVSGSELIEVIVKAEDEDEAITKILVGDFARYLPLDNSNLKTTLNTKRELVFDVSN